VDFFAEGESLAYGKKHFASTDQTGMSAWHMSGCRYQQHKDVLQAVYQSPGYFLVQNCNESTYAHLHARRS
jgi:hypothetical protein